MLSTKYDVVLVGAGLCGLSSAVILKNKGYRVLVLEAGAEVGGRIHSVRDHHSHMHLGDLGPSWVWPRQQPILSEWLQSLGVSVIEQFAQGESIVETADLGAPARLQLEEQPGVYRLDQGTAALISALVKKLDPSGIRCSHPVTSIDTSDAIAEIHCAGISKPINSRYVVVCSPLRVARKRIQYNPELPDDLVACFDRTPTWMAQQAKVVLLYANCFWRQQGLSGRVHSQFGPIAELQDHCGPGGSPAALCGFLGWSARERDARRDELPGEIHQQLKRLFGDSAPPPMQIVVKDWAQDRFIATHSDQLPGYPARQALPELVRQAHGMGRLWFACSETAKLSPGLIEGAFVSARQVAQDLDRALQSS